MSRHALEEVHSRPDQLGASGGEHQGLAVGGDYQHVGQDDDTKRIASSTMSQISLSSFLESNFKVARLANH